MKFAARILLFTSLVATFAYAQTPFQHIIVIAQENRTPDNLFQGLCAPPYGACPSPYNISPNGVVPCTDRAHPGPAVRRPRSRP